MALSVVSVAAATAVLGADLLAARPDIAVSGRDRTLRAVGLTGSAAAGDSAADFNVGNVKVSSLFNTATGFPAADAAMFKTAFHVPAGTPLSIIVTDAAATNALNALVDI
jgi:uncharacterized membrane protein